MSANQRTIDLLIKAKLQGLRDFDTVNKSIADLSKVIDKQSQAVNKSADSYGKLRAARSSLSDLGSELQSLNSLVGSYTKVKDAVDSTTAKLTSQEVKLKSLTDEINKSGKATETQTERQRRLESAIDKTKTSIKSQTDLMRDYENSLKGAGINTTKLAESQSRLQGAINTVASANVKNRNAIEKVNTAQANGFKLQRTSLDLYQRIRGQILSVTATYVGLYGAIELVNSSVAASTTKESIINQLSIGTKGDLKAAGEEFEYISNQADRLGINLEVAAKGYAKFNASAILAGRTRDESRFTFESFSEVARVLNLTGEAQDRGIYAMSQIFSKGKVMAEEFNGQLGDLLPGLQGVAKEALKVKFPDFNKAMKDGKVGLDDFITIMAKYRDSVANQLPKAIESLQAKQERLNNAIFRFKIQLSESGVADEFSKLIEELTSFFDSNEGTNFAKDLAQAFTIVGKILRFIVENFQTIATLTASFVGFKIIKGITVEVLALYTAINTLLPKVEAFILLMRGLPLALTAAGAGAGAALAGWGIGTWLSEKSSTVRKFGIVMAEIMATSAMKVKSVWLDVTDSLKIYFSELVASYARSIQKFISLIPGMAAQADKFGVIAKGFEDKSATLSSGKKSRNIREQKDIRTIEELTLRAFMEAEKDPNAKSTGKPKTSVVTSRPTSGDGSSPTGMSPEEVEKRRKKMAQLIESINGQLNSLEDSVQKKTADTLQEKLDAIASDYSNLQKKIAQVSDPKQRTEMTSRLNKAKQALESEARDDYNKRVLEERRKLETDLEQAEADAGRREVTSLDARLNAVEAKYKEKFDAIEKYRKMLADGGQATGDADSREKALRSAVEESKVLETKKFHLDEINRLEQRATDLVDQRTARLKVIEIEKNTGAITDTQAIEKTAIVVSELQPKIMEAARAAYEYAIAHQEAFGTESATKVAELKAKMDELVASGSGLRTSFISLREVQEGFAGAASAGVGALAKGLGDAIVGAGNLKQAFHNARNAFLSFAADFLQKIAMMIIQERILQAIKSSSSSGGGGFWGTLLNMGASYFSGGSAGAASGGSTFTGSTTMVAHSGALVNNTASRSRSINPAAFIGAPRYHKGGIVGLQANEVPAILQKNEEVLSKSDPRNALNGGGASANSSVTQPQNIKIMNMIDSSSVISEGLSTQEGTKAIINFMRANRTQLKSVLG